MARMCRKQNGEPCSVPSAHVSPKAESILTKKEIERKFLIMENDNIHASYPFLGIFQCVSDLVVKARLDGTRIVQGYLPMGYAKELATAAGLTVVFHPWEARLRLKGDKFYFTLKGKGGLTRNEAEKEISGDLFNEYWKLTEGKVDKTRLKVTHGKLEIEFDVYNDRKLIVAEMEFSSETEARSAPCIGKDITEDDRYKNRNLAK